MALFGILVGLVCLDRPPPEDVHLRLSWDEIPETDNGWAFVASPDLPWRDAPNHIGYGKRSTWGNWTPDEVAPICAMNAPFFARMNEAVLKPKFQAPPFIVSGDLHENGAGHFSPIRNLSQLACLDAHRAIRVGEWGTAVGRATDLIALGRRIQLAKGSPYFSDLRLGIQVEIAGFVAAKAIMETGGRRIDRASLQRLNSRLSEVEALGSLRDLVRRQVQSYYSEQGAILDEYLRGTVNLHFEVAEPPLLHLAKPNAARRRLAVFAQALWDNAGTPLSTRAAWDVPPPSGLDWLTVNPTGLWLGERFRPMIDGWFELLYQRRLGTRMLALAVALERHRDAEGTLPSTLDALVPAYLDAVPADPFDGLPIRWDPATREISSPARGEQERIRLPE